MRKHWLAFILFCAGTAQAQFVKNTGIVLFNTADVTVNSDWDNTNASFMNNGTITTSDNWTSTGGYSQAGTGGFVLTNTATMQFNHAGQYVGTLTKNGAGNTQINNHVIVKNTLTLTSGLLTMTGVNDTIVTLANAIISGGSPTSYVTGKVSRYGNGDLFFPISSGANYMPITLYQVAGTNPRVTVTVQAAPGGYTINGAGNSLIPFPNVWKSAVVRGDTATYVEVSYPSGLITTPATALIARSVDPTHYGSMGVQSVTTAGGITKIKSYSQGLRGLFTVAQGVLLPLDAPVAAAPFATTSTGFTANWGAVNNATGYLLDVSTDNFATFLSGYQNLALAGTSQVITGLSPLISYQYRVRATGTAPTSSNSNVITATTAIGAPLATAATSIAAVGFVANWNPVTAATGYQLDISSDNFATFISGYNSKSVTTTSESVTGLSVGTAYKYRVRATTSTSTSANSNVIDVTTLAKQDQTISFTAIPDKSLGDSAFAVTATATSSLPVSLTTASDKITIAGGQVTLVKAGRATITATQGGNAVYNPAPAVDRSFCIKPAKPAVTLSNANSESPILTSNATSGNQWYLNGSPIAGATNPTLNVTSAGVYKVQVKMDDCVSDFSSDVPIIVTGDNSTTAEKIVLYPNPAEDYIQITGIEGAIAGAQLIDVTGKNAGVELNEKSGVLSASVQHLHAGFYVLRIQQVNAVHQIKFVKK